MDRERSSCVGFVGLLQLVFIVLKLCKVIDWSWWVVMIPMLASAGITAVMFIIVLILAVSGAVRKW
jgi:hypothetical protein